MPSLERPTGLTVSGIPGRRTPFDTNDSLWGDMFWQYSGHCKEVVASMGSIEEIDRAIAAHGLWKDRLRAAIESGATEFPIATIRGDEACEFGIWLYGPSLSCTEKATLDYNNIIDLHAHFHNVAGRVVELAVGGNKADAEMLLSRDFRLASEKLMVAMVAWKEDIKAANASAMR